MQHKIFLRIAAAIMLLHTLGHTLGAFTWKNAPTAKVALLIKGMENEHFNFMGRQASLAAFYSGYGIIMIFVLLMVTILLWLLSINPVRSILVVLGVFMVALALCEYVYFFPFAAVFSLAAACCVWIAYSRVPSTKKIYKN